MTMKADGKLKSPPPPCTSMLVLAKGEINWLTLLKLITITYKTDERLGGGQLSMTNLTSTEAENEAILLPAVKLENPNKILEILGKRNCYNNCN